MQLLMFNIFLFIHKLLDDDQNKEIKYSSDACGDISVSSRSDTPLLSFGDSNLSIT